MDIKEKLRFIEALPRNKNTVAPSVSPSKPGRLSDILPGETKQTEFGSFYCAQKSVPIDEQHGQVKLSELFDCCPTILPLIGKDPALKDVDLRRVLFIDTETTGLVGGSGTYAFLIGIGFFTGNTFQIEQLFMNDLDEEKAILHHLQSYLENCELIVSFNGKCYDFPLLLTRKICHRIKSRFLDLSHLDLLFTARRLWKHRIGDCSLQSTEHHILEVRRYGDVPGYLIPYFYFRYLRDRNPTPLQPIFYHNQMDILTMVALLTKAMQIVSRPLTQCENAGDALAIGKMYEGLMRYGESIDFYQKYLDMETTNADRGEILMRTAFNFKRLQKWPDAASLWNKYLEEEAFHPLPYIELAKHYEHREKNLRKAKQLVDKALAEMNVLQGLQRKMEWLDYKTDLQYRLERIKRKANNGVV